MSSLSNLRGANNGQVVIDPTINPDCMEMYADEEARGGVLEPEGIIGIKYRRDRQLETMARLDSTYASLRRRLAEAQSRGAAAEEVSTIKLEMTQREELLLPVYSQIAWQFADLHDRTGRMQAKETIRMPLRWREARRFFYWRLRRRLNEESVLRKMRAPVSVPSAAAKGAAASEPMSRARCLTTLRAWTGLADFDTADRAVAAWYEEHRRDVAQKIDALRAEQVTTDLAGVLGGTDRDAALRGVRQWLSMKPVEEREKVLKFLQSQ